MIAASRDCGFGPGVAERRGVDGRRGLRALGGREAAVRLGRLLLRPGVEVAHERRPVVLRDERDERLRQLALVGEVDAVGDVLLEHWALTSGSSWSWMFSPPAWFSMNAERVRELADVVVVGRDARDERVGADGLGRPLGEVADHQRVVVRAGRLEEQPPQQRLRRVRQLEQLEDRGDAEEVAEDREGADRGHAPSQPAADAPTRTRAG